MKTTAVVILLQSQFAIYFTWFYCHTKWYSMWIKWKQQEAPVECNEIQTCFSFNRFTFDIHLSVLPTQINAIRNEYHMTTGMNGGGGLVPNHTERKWERQKEREKEKQAVSSESENQTLLKRKESCFWSNNGANPMIEHKQI